MQILEIIILGIVQGLTEFIPISSSGHLVIVQHLFAGFSDHLLLEFINIGTFLALIVYFRKKILDIIRDVFVRRNYRLAINILLTALPAGITGFMLSEYIQSSLFFGSLVVVTITLGVVGVVMVILERLPKASAIESGEALPAERALFIGLAQVLALIPGVSRSGSTIIAGRLAGLTPASAAEYSFLASLPIMFGVTLKTLIGDQEYLYENLGLLVLGNAAAFIAGLLAVGFLMKYLANHGLAVFGWYRIGLATVLAFVLLLQ